MLAMFSDGTAEIFHVTPAAKLNDSPVSSDTDEKGLGETPCLVPISSHNNLFASRLPNLQLPQIRFKRKADFKQSKLFQKYYGIQGSLSIFSFKSTKVITSLIFIEKKGKT